MAQHVERTRASGRITFGSCTHVGCIRDHNEDNLLVSSPLFAVADGLGTQPFASIELVGLVSSMCVLSNAVIARTACPNVPIIVDASCTASADAKLHEAALDVLEGVQIKVTNRA